MGAKEKTGAREGYTRGVDNHVPYYRKLTLHEINANR